MGVLHGNFIEGEEQIIYDEEKVRADLGKVLDLLAQSQEVIITEYPKIEIKKGYHSNYNPHLNVLSIRPFCIGNGDIYFHEASHALRYHARDSGRDYSSHNRTVQEFFGYAGMIFGRGFFLQGKLCHLFAHKQPLSDLFSERRVSYIKEILRYKRVFSEVRGKFEVCERRKNMTAPFRHLVKDFIDHVRALDYASQYSFDNLISYKGLYRLSDREIKERFFRKKKDTVRLS